jgi:hypothetical protein
MARRGTIALATAALALAGWLAPAGSAHAQYPPSQTNTYFHYPYNYYPHNYWPNQVRWPDVRVPFQQPPAYMAYPRMQDPFFRYEILESRRYHRGFHFFLDQF